MAFHLTGAAAETVPAHTDLYKCPIRTCGWGYVPPPLPAIEPSVLSPCTVSPPALRLYRVELEAVLEEHFESHTPAEYITEISNLKGLNISLIKQMRELGEAFKDTLKASPDLRREVDPAVQLSVSLGQYPVTGL